MTEDGVAPASLPETDGRLADNIVHFARALRKAGLRVGPAQVEEAIRAVHAVGFTSRADYFHTLRAVLVNRPEHLDVFAEVFALFWRDPDYLERMIHLLSPTMQRDQKEDQDRKRAASRRASDALSADAPPPPKKAKERDELVIDATLSFSQSETLRSMDFEQMTGAEAAEAARMIRRLTLPVDPVATRRSRQASHGPQVDMRATLRASLRRAGEIDRLVRRTTRSRAPDLVVLCDISGSMTAYARMMMHFLHSLAWAPQTARQHASHYGSWRHVHAFTFGTRLTNITRALHRRDVDRALDAIAQEAQDWQGGTRIGEALYRFNKDWSRRVLTQGAAVLLITDGLERGDVDLLRTEAERLKLSCRRLIWLNPLLRFDGFEPQAAGIRALLPAVHSLHACHSVSSLEDLARALARPVATDQAPTHGHAA